MNNYKLKPFTSHFFRRGIEGVVTLRLKPPLSPFEKGGLKSNKISGGTLIPILFIAFIMSTTNIYAETSKQTTTITGKKTQSEKKTKNSTRAKKFIPTEKIQADTSVPFPVDI